MSTLMELARRVARSTALAVGEKGDKGEKPVAPVPFSPLSPFSHPDGAAGATLTLPGNEPWDRRVAMKLVCDADALVGSFGVSGNHPAIRDAAALVGSAFDTRDLETLRFAVSEFAAAVRGVVREHFRAEQSEENRAQTGASRSRRR